MNEIKEKFPSFSDDLKCELKWLEEQRNSQEKITGLKQQKFLLFYNLFLKSAKQVGNFTGLCAWKDGPVYTQVHAAIKHHFTIKEIIESIEENITIDETLANVAKFIVELLSDEEVSELTHQFDFWTMIDDNYQNNQILETNISTADQQKILQVLHFYDLEFINHHKIYKTKNTTFFIAKEQYNFVVQNFKNELERVRNDKPVKIELDSNRLKQTESKKLFI